jgi:ABC-type arginine/histidine transport system permease subunit
VYQFSHQLIDDHHDFSQEIVVELYVYHSSQIIGHFVGLALAVNTHNNSLGASDTVTCIKSQYILLISTPLTLQVFHNAC